MISSFTRLVGLWALILLICLPATSQAWDGTWSRSEFRARWVNADSEGLSADDLNRLFAYLERDAETFKMLESLKRLTGKQSAMELMALIRLCDEERGLLPPDRMGATDVTDDGVRTICMSRRLSMGDAIATFVHELTHYIRIRSYCSKDPKKYVDSSRFALETIQEPGDEVDAFLTEFSARIRLEHSRTGVPYLYREMFSESGQYEGTREEFARLLLAIPGYANDFARRFSVCKAQLAKAP